MKPIFFFIILIFCLSLTSALICSDSFYVTDDIIQICGYCSENNMTSPCSNTRNCNFTLYYNNLSVLATDLQTDNYGDGTFVHNITQNITGYNLTGGKYFGEMYCGPRSRDIFSFTVNAPAKGFSSGYGGSRLTLTPDGNITLEREENRIPHDINKYLKSGASKISSKETTGKFLLWCVLLIFIFSPEIHLLIKKVRLKKKW